MALLNPNQAIATDDRKAYSSSNDFEVLGIRCFTWLKRPPPHISSAEQRKLNKMKDHTNLSRAALSGPAGSGELIGQPALMRGLYELIGKVSQSTSAVLVIGETGTGKELVARGIHFTGMRRSCVTPLRSEVSMGSSWIARAAPRDSSALLQSTRTRLLLGMPMRGAWANHDLQRRNYEHS